MLGKAFREALAISAASCAVADASVPMDDALAMVAVDISGRGYSKLELGLAENDMFGFPPTWYATSWRPWPARLA